MFSLAVKNAILMILIILIIHFLIKNFLLPIKVEKYSEHIHTQAEQAESTSIKSNVEKDEDDLYKFISSNKPPTIDYTETSNDIIDMLGTFSKTGYDSFSPPLM
jgi:hypothetical protein